MIRTILLSGGAAWVFVKAITLVFGLIALSRLLPVPDRQVPGYRRRPGRALVAVSAAVIAGFVTTFLLTSPSGHAAHAVVLDISPAATRSPAATTLLGTHRYLGVFEAREQASWQPVARFGTAVGRQPQIVLCYSGWGSPFPSALARTASAHGATVLDQLLPTGVSMAAIARGRYDAYLRSWAAAVRAARHQVIVSFAPEMNGNWYSWGWRHTAPAVWVAAWRHVVTVVRRAGARNVTWLWTVNREYATSGPLRDYWPGPGYVTWAGVDGYLVKPADTFGNVLAPTIAAVRRITAKPVLLAETAIGPKAGQVAKIPGLVAGVRSDHLLGLVWFDMAQYGGLHHQDWRLEDNPAALAAFRRAVQRYL